MNLAESMKHVLKTRGQNIFTEFWRDDLRVILKDFRDDFLKMGQSGSMKLRSLRGHNLRSMATEVRDSAIDTILIFRIVPQRLREGFGIFRQDLLSELETQTDSRQKALFCLKVFSALGGSTLMAFYGMKKSGANAGVTFNGLKIRNAFTHYVLSELVFKISQLFILRFLSEISRHLSDEEDRKRLRFFRDLLSDSSRFGDSAEWPLDEDPESADKAITIVENLKNYILTGKKSA